MPKASVIGAGVGGMAVAIRLALKGYDVHVFESHDSPGGKINQLENQGFRWDMGPSLFTLPYLLDELFVAAGVNSKEYYSYSQLPVITKYFFPDKTVVNAYQNVDELCQELQVKLKEPTENVYSFLAKVKQNYEFTKPIFLENPIREFYKNYEGSIFSNLRKLTKLDALPTMAKRNTLSFNNPKTTQIFNRYATYNGSDPYRAPATLNLIAHLEHELGAFFLKGGMYTVTKSLFKLAKEVGVNFNFNSPVEAILHEGKKTYGVKVSGKEIHSDIVVSNGDVKHTYKYLMKDAKAPSIYLNQEQSTSALVFYWGMKGDFPELDVHNILFSKDYKNEFSHLQNGKVIDDPTVYLYLSSKLNPADAPDGCTNWFAMINVPHNTGQDWETIEKEARKNILLKIQDQFNIDVSNSIVCEEVLTPVSLEKRTSSFAGALYGNSSNSMFSAFLRHPNYRSNMNNLYFVGGSVHPGGGIPLCLLSAKIVSDQL